MLLMGLRQFGLGRSACVFVHGVNRALFLQTGDEALHQAAEFRGLHGREVLLLEGVSREVEQLVVRVLRNFGR